MNSLRKRLLRAIGGLLGQKIPLSTSIRYGKIDDVRMAIEEGYDLNYHMIYSKDSFVFPLLEAVFFGKYDICKLLVSKKADPNYHYFQNNSNENSGEGNAFDSFLCVYHDPERRLSQETKPRFDNFDLSSFEPWYFITPTILSLLLGDVDILKLMLSSGGKILPFFNHNDYSFFKYFSDHDRMLNRQICQVLIDHKVFYLEESEMTEFKIFSRNLDEYKQIVKENDSDQNEGKYIGHRNEITEIEAIIGMLENYGFENSTQPPPMLYFMNNQEGSTPSENEEEKTKNEKPFTVPILPSHSRNKYLYCPSSIEEPASFEDVILPREITRKMKELQLDISKRRRRTVSTPETVSPVVFRKMNENYFRCLSPEDEERENQNVEEEKLSSSSSSEEEEKRDIMKKKDQKEEEEEEEFQNRKLSEFVLTRKPHIQSLIDEGMGRRKSICLGLTSYVSGNNSSTTSTASSDDHHHHPRSRYYHTKEFLYWGGGENNNKKNKKRTKKKKKNKNKNSSMKELCSSVTKSPHRFERPSSSFCLKKDLKSSKRMVKKSINWRKKNPEKLKIPLIIKNPNFGI